MLAEAKVKAAASATGPCLQFHVMDAANLSFASQQFDVILCRHLLWALPFPDQVLRHWADLLKPAGRLLLIEGYWHTGAGLPSREVVKALPPIFTDVKTENLSAHTELWGKPVTDERYIVIAALPASV
jgi:ubiquinone/menaquinone biosynthesis C-methylase UbiE